MPQILQVSHAFPAHHCSQQRLKAAVRSIFSGRLPELERQLSVFDNARVEQRQLLMPLDWYLRPHSAQERNRAFLEEGMALLRRAVEKVLGAARLSATQIDHLIYVNSTGHATPTLDARLINELDFSPQTTRLPIWGLGCAGGAAGLARAWDYCRAHPQARVLLSALECCSLTLLPEDLSTKNLVGTALFADGAAAVLVVGDEVSEPGAGPRIVATRSQLLPDSYQVMGWNFCDQGMELVLSPRLPALIKRVLPEMVESLLARQGLVRQDLAHYLIHPGGARVLDAVQEALSLSAETLALSETQLNRRGNISSVSLLLVLEAWLKTQGSRLPGHSLLAAFGPGFSGELLLLEV